MFENGEKMIDNIILVLTIGLAFLLLGWLIVSPIVFVFWFFDANMRTRFVERHGGIAIAVFSGTFICLFCILFLGIEKLLVFIPSDWGRYDEDGEFVSATSMIAMVLAIPPFLFFYYVLGTFGEIRSENRRLTIIVEIQKRKDALPHYNRDLLIKKRDETQTELEGLRDLRNDRGFLSADKKGELQILNAILEELKYRIGEIEQSDALDEE